MKPHCNEAKIKLIKDREALVFRSCLIIFYIGQTVSGILGQF